MSVQEICVVVVVADSCQAVVLDNAKKLQSVSQHHFIQFFDFVGKSLSPQHRLS